MNAINKNEVSMFEVGEAVVLKNSSQNKVMKIQAHNDEFIRAYYGDQDYSFAHESNFRHATPEEIEACHRIDCEILDYPEDYTSPNCKKYDERVK